MFSLARLRHALHTWFHNSLNTMVFNPWNAIIDYYLYQPVSHVLFYFTTAASASPTPGIVLDRLSVVWIWLNKHPDPPEHEYIIIETKDSQDGKTRLFIIDRGVQKTDSELPKGTTSKKDSKRPDTRSYQLLDNIQGLLSPSPSPLSSMEEGTLTPSSSSTPTLYPPVSFQTPQHSIGDALSLTASKTSEMLSDSLDKGEKSQALDRILGENVILRRRYGLGQNARQIKPNNLKFFELVVLAQAVHDFAPHYSHLGRNCYWFCNIMIDAIIEIFGLDDSISPEDSARETQYMPIDPHQSTISGRWKGWKVSHTAPEDLSRIVYDFKKAHTVVISEVNLSSKLLFLTNHKF
jgi:hypothetical protein